MDDALEKYIKETLKEYIKQSAEEDYIKQSAEEDYIEFAKDSYLIDLPIIQMLVIFTIIGELMIGWICTNCPQSRHTGFISQYNAYILKNWSKL